MQKAAGQNRAGASGQEGSPCPALPPDLPRPGGEQNIQNIQIPKGGGIVPAQRGRQGGKVQVLIQGADGVVAATGDTVMEFVRCYAGTAGCVSERADG